MSATSSTDSHLQPTASPLCTDRPDLVLAFRIVVLVIWGWILAIGTWWFPGLWQSDLAALIGFVLFGLSLWGLFAAGMILATEAASGVFRSSLKSRWFLAAALWSAGMVISVGFIWIAWGAIGAGVV